jgi:hypothetical protein
MLAAVESDDELAAGRGEALQRMRPTSRKIPEITLFDVVDAGKRIRYSENYSATFSLRKSESVLTSPSRRNPATCATSLSSAAGTRGQKNFI